jgi:radical SAM protein with 4Fe4S-binding SPASM domain
MSSRGLVLPSCKGYSLFRVPDGYLAVDPQRSHWVRLARDEVPAFQLIDGKKSVSELRKTVSETLPPLLARASNILLAKLASAPLRRLTSHHRPTHPKQLYLVVTDRCNSRCPYCFRGRAGTTLMPRELAVRALKEFAGMAGSEGNVILTGGEPLLHPQIEELIWQSHRLKLKTTLQTNSTLLTKSMAQRIAPAINLVQISVDSTVSHINDFLRGYQGQLKCVQGAVAALRSHGVPVSLCATITTKNLADITRIPCAYPDCHFKSSPLLGIGRGRRQRGLAPTASRFLRAFRQAQNLQHAPSPKSQAPTFGRKILLCDAGTGVLSVAPDGRVYPCQSLHHPKWMCGDLHHQSLRRIYARSKVICQLRKLTVDDVSGCRTCDLRYICGGGCRANAFWRTYDIQSRDPWCKVIKAWLISAMLTTYSLAPTEVFLAGRIAVNKVPEERPF